MEIRRGERIRMQASGKLQFGLEEKYDFTSDDLQDLGEIGRGAFGAVNKMIFKRTNTVMAVKRIRSTVDEKEQKILLMDLEVVMKSNDCNYIVQFYGALFKEVSYTPCTCTFSPRSSATLSTLNMALMMKSSVKKTTAFS